MTKSDRFWSRFALAGMLGATLVLGTAGLAVQAADDNDEIELPDAKLWKGIMKSMGLRGDEDTIEYRERAPLVLPASRDLPAPDRNAKAKTTNWPDDPDVKRAAKRKTERKYSNPDPDDASRPMLPSQYSLPGGGTRTSQPDGSNRSIEVSSAPMSTYELGSKSIFSSWWGGSKEEYSTFTSEPPRGRLIDPPAGYRTPSPNQPYGVGQQTYNSNIPLINRSDDVK